METVLSEKKLKVVAHVLKTVAHPTRIAIIHALKGNEGLSVSDICAKLGGVDQSLTSHHLSIMKLKGILGNRRNGRNIYYYLKLQEVIKVIDCVENCTMDFDL